MWKTDHYKARIYFEKHIIGKKCSNFFNFSKSWFFEIFDFWDFHPDSKNFMRIRDFSDLETFSKSRFKNLKNLDQKSRFQNRSCWTEILARFRNEWKIQSSKFKNPVQQDRKIDCWTEISKNPVQQIKISIAGLKFKNSVQQKFFKILRPKIDLESRNRSRASKLRLELQKRLKISYKRNL